MAEVKGQRPDETEYAKFLSALFELLSLGSPSVLRQYARGARAINDDLGRVIDILANYSAEYIGSVRGRPVATEIDTPSRRNLSGDIEILFRNKTLFPHNEALMRFLSSRFAMGFGSSSYSRTSIIRMFLTKAREFPESQIEEMVQGLRAVLSPQRAASGDDFYRKWSALIRNS